MAGLGVPWIEKLFAPSGTICTPFRSASPTLAMTLLSTEIVPSALTATAAQHGIARLGLELPVGGKHEVSVAGVAFTVGRLDFEECAAFDGEIEFAGGVLHISRGDIDARAAQNAVVVHGAVQRILIGCGIRDQRAEVLPLGLVAGGVDVGKIVSGDFQSIRSGDKSCACGVIATSHD